MFKILTEARNWLWQKGIDWLNAIPPNEQQHGLCHFEFLEREVRPGDVILFAGMTRVSKVIQMVALSPWTHAAIYIGRVNDIQNPKTRALLEKHFSGDHNEQLVAESLLGFGTIVTPLREYHSENLRICRPSGLDWRDSDQVVNQAISHLGMEYDVKQLLDLARFTFPYGILPRRWRSSLFQHNAGKPTQIICSSMIARCFQHVNYPILPTVSNDQQASVSLRERNFRLIIPSDFDYSPYFEIVKYPAWNFSDQPAYRNLPWQNQQSPIETLPEKPEQLPTRLPASDANAPELPVDSDSSPIGQSPVLQ